MKKYFIEITEDYYIERHQITKHMIKFRCNIYFYSFLDIDISYINIYCVGKRIILKNLQLQKKIYWKENLVYK